MYTYLENGMQETKKSLTENTQHKFFRKTNWKPSFLVRLIGKQSVYHYQSGSPENNSLTKFNQVSCCIVRRNELDIFVYRPGFLIFDFFFFAFSRLTG